MRIQQPYWLILFFLILLSNVSSLSLAQTHSKNSKGVSTEAIATLTNQLTDLASQYQNKNTPNRDSLHSQLDQIIKARQAEMELLAEKDPKKFLDRALPVKTRNMLPAELKANVEQPVTMEGQLEVMVQEDSKTQLSETVYSLISSTPSAPTKRHYLYFATGSPNIKTGDRIRVTGIKPSRNSMKIAMAGPSNALVIPSLTASKGTDLSPQMSLLPSDRKILVILMNFRNLTLPGQCSVSSLQNAIFVDPDGLKNFYQQTSFNSLNFSGDIAGPYTIDTNVGNSCDLFSWTDAADVMAQSQYNLNNYQHIVHIMPYTGTCAATGMGTVGGNWSMVQGCSNDGINHEIGHNLGMHHAARRVAQGGLNEYGDSSDFMATGYAQLNAPHMEQMQWTASNNIETVTTAGVYTIYPLHNNSTMRQIIKIPYPCPGGGNGCFYYVSLRGPQENWASVGSFFTHRASIHSFNTSLIAQTVLQKTLNDGQSFEDINNGILIEQTGHAADGSSITVFIDPHHVFSCVRQPPTIELNSEVNSIYQGRTLLLDGTITNNDSSACNSNVFSLQIEGQGSIISQFFPSTVTLAPGASQSFSLELTTNLNTPAGQYPLQITGSNTAFPDIRNTVSFPFSVLDLALAPDLTILNISHAPTVVMEGDTVTFTSLIRNQGATDAIIHSGGAGAPYFLITIDNQRNIWCEITSLSSGSSQTFSCGPWQATLGTHQIRAVVNPLNLLIESNHFNNQYLRTLVVVPYRDITPPTGSILINPQPASTPSKLSLTLNATDSGSGMGVGASMQFSNEGSSWSNWMPYATTTMWYANSGLGFKRVHARFKDVAGNVSMIYSASITILDVTPPTGYASVGQRSGNYVNLMLYAYDSESGMLPPQAQMKFSNDNSTWSIPETFASSKWWPLSPGYGSKTIYIKFKDAAGNWSNSTLVNLIFQAPKA